MPHWAWSLLNLLFNVAFAGMILYVLLATGLVKVKLRGRR
jgi:hypothetical protein